VINTKLLSALDFLIEHQDCVAEPFNEHGCSYRSYLRYDKFIDCFYWVDNEGNQVSNHGMLILGDKIMKSDCKIYHLVHKPKTVYAYHDSVPIVAFDNYRICLEEI
jgi:hypothetical protein